MDKKQKSKNDIVWEALFEKYDILNQINEDGKYVISAAAIKEFREPRLMAKFDHKINLPQIFEENNLAILPISRGDYVLSHFQAYADFQASAQPITHVKLPAHLESLHADGINSEAIALNCAFASGMLADFLEEDMLYATVSGRMSSGQFDYQITNTKTGKNMLLSVNNAQIEIDAAYEGKEYLVLLEAKIALSDDFLIRQLYYPFRTWKDRITKKIRPVFLVYSNSIFHLYEYQFTEPNSYHSLAFIQHKKYAIENTTIKESDIVHIAEQAQFIEEPHVPFPQADSFARVINLCELLQTQDLSHEQITNQYAFNDRQTGYYTNAVQYLGLVKKYKKEKTSFYTLTAYGRNTLNLNYRQRQLEFCKAILQHPVFHKVFWLAMQTKTIPDKKTIVQIMQQSDLYRIESLDTFDRRSSTVRGWIKWMLGLSENRHTSSSIHTQGNGFLH